MAAMDDTATPDRTADTSKKVWIFVLILILLGLLSVYSYWTIRAFSGVEVTVSLDENPPVVLQSADAAYLVRGTTVYPDCAAGGGDLLVRKRGSSSAARWLGPSTAQVEGVRSCETDEAIHVDGNLRKMADRASD